MNNMKHFGLLVITFLGLVVPCQAMLARLGASAAGQFVASMAGQLPLDGAAHLLADGADYARGLIGARIPEFNRAQADDLLANFQYKELNEWLNTCVDRHEPSEYPAVKAWLTEMLRHPHFPIKYLYIKMIFSDPASTQEELQEALVQMIICSILFIEDALWCQAHGLISQNQPIPEDVKKPQASRRLHGKGYRLLGGYKALYLHLIQKFIGRMEQFKGNRAWLPGLEVVGDYGAAFARAAEYFTAVHWLEKVRHVPAWASGANEYTQTRFAAVYKGIYFKSLDEYVISAALGSKPIKASILRYRNIMHGRLLERFGSIQTWRSFFSNTLPIALDDEYLARAAARVTASQLADDSEGADDSHGDGEEPAYDPYSDYSDDEIAGRVPQLVAAVHDAGTITHSVGRAATVDGDARSCRSARPPVQYGLSSGKSVGKPVMDETRSHSSSHHTTPQLSAFTADRRGRLSSAAGLSPAVAATSGLELPGTQVSALQLPPSSAQDTPYPTAEQLRAQQPAAASTGLGRPFAGLSLVAGSNDALLPVQPPQQCVMDASIMAVRGDADGGLQQGTPGGKGGIHRKKKGGQAAAPAHRAGDDSD